MSCDHFKSCHGKCCRRRSILTLATHELTTQVFADLFGGDILGLVVPDFWPPGDCQRLAEKFGETFVAYADAETGASEVLRSFHSQALYERQADYFAGAVGSLRALREVAEPGLLPMSKLRAILDDEWPAGASLMRFDGHTARFGLVRNIATEARAHVDDCRRDRPDLRETAGVVAQFLANVYLTPFNGGELELWDYRPTPEEVAAWTVPGDYSLDLSKIGPPSAVIKPTPGMLVVAFANNPHRVRPVSHGNRFAQSGFIAYRGPANALGLFS